MRLRVHWFTPPANLYFSPKRKTDDTLGSRPFTKVYVGRMIRRPLSRPQSCARTITMSFSV
ncbi:hypothetical protein J2045_002694 [Peteryoungia aggregata LMG 23059]|uniref:Uncharacterized protein n=1 Tax=Peteryoungia aggregata LMG 23059 TaxID=1368425 RepID=A0ABU0G8J1_9HYPH|nr:hypothetical protein [Peteryoungia aggregata LMG 23059]